ncbi:Very-long-chain (3R)-3-hydroxyacyl-CoA dehydratase hpo-8 [Diplonema papillatum]|nr:Very-long-chain (3R)-3-hydroxyacyl-CoA dehydratase hpo-8 [Diplonema papillatum]
MAKRALQGVEFPPDASGARSTTVVNQGTFEAAIRAVSPEQADAVKNARGWRFSYVKHLLAQVKTAAGSPKNAYAIAEAGEKHMHDQMVYIRDPDGAEEPLSAAMKKYNDKFFQTATIKGNGPKVSQYTVPYHDKNLSGTELAQQIETWVRQGVIELSCGASLEKTMKHAEWLDLSDRYFVLFGAASAMGPYLQLMDMGANVIALDLDRPGIWKYLIEKARTSAGTLIFPTSKDPSGKSDDQLAEIAGCNLLTKTPEVRTWLADIFPTKELVLGAYAYLDGPLFVKVSVAMDAIIKDLVAKRKVKPALAYLCTPTDAHIVTNTAMTQAKSNYNKQPLWQSAIAALLSLTPKRMTKNFQKPVEGTDLTVGDAVVADQGPNYILAKRLQHWRAILSRRDGCIVSTNIAPSTATVSVVSNRAFALAYKGMHHFKPVEVFMQATSNAVMTGLLICDLNDTTGAANPKTQLANPMCLFTENAFHGGAWRCAYKFGTIGVPSVLAALWGMYVVSPYLMAYNFAQVYGWGQALLGWIQHEASGSGTGLWAQIGGKVTHYQYLAGLEVIHALLGLVRSDAATTFLQILSRVVVVSVLNECPAQFANDNIYIRLMLFAWSLTEVVRYLFYGVPVNNKVLTWLRYSMFIVLYPMGVIGEVGCLNHAATTAPDSKTAVVLPLLKYMYQHGGGVYTLITVYVVGLSVMYGHMLAQRAKVLGGKPKAVSPAKKNN